MTAKATSENARDIPEATVARLPVYLRALVTLSDAGTGPAPARSSRPPPGVNSAKLRKDLSYLGSYGTRGVGYDVDYLRYQIAREIGVTQDWPVVIVGIGNLGHALANYSGFRSRGFRVVALLDADPERHQEVVAGVDVRPFDDLEQIVREQGVAIGVIATPAAAAQDVADQMVAGGITSILNFAPDRARRARRGRRAQGRPLRSSCRSSPTTSSARRPGRRRHDASSSSASPTAPRPISLLERLAVDGDGATKLIEDVLANPHVTEADGGRDLQPAGDLRRRRPLPRQRRGPLAGCCQRAGRAVEALLPHLYVHYDDGAVSHLFQVAAGLDSMAVGEAPDPRPDPRRAGPGQEPGSVGPILNTLFQQALRVGKRAHAETGIDRAAPTLVSRRARPGRRRPRWAAASSSSARVGWPASPSRPSYAVGPARSSSSTARPSAPSASPASTPRAGRR